MLTSFADFAIERFDPPIERRVHIFNLFANLRDKGTMGVVLPCQLSYAGVALLTLFSSAILET
jgi:hypothetical protein